MSHHVVIVGGGVGALEGVLALQELAGDRVRISLVTPGRHLAYRALAVAEPFGGAGAPHYEWDVIAGDRGVEWIPDTLEEVRGRAREILTREGPALGYDALVLAVGARPLVGVPGALLFSGPRDVHAMREAIEGLGPGRCHRLAFVAPAGATWTLPLYELALMTAAHGRREGLDLDIELVTREREPLCAFGDAASAAVAARLATAGIRVRTSALAREYADGRLSLELEEPLDVDLAVALPQLAGPALRGLPADADGFVPVDAYGRVRGMDRVWAVGDMTARPLRQGGLAAQQADVAARDIAVAVAGAELRVRPYKPKLRGLLLTGDQPLYLERRPSAPPASEASERFLWWPAHKVVGRRIGPYLESLGSPVPH